MIIMRRMTAQVRFADSCPMPTHGPTLATSRQAVSDRDVGPILLDADSRADNISARRWRETSSLALVPLSDFWGTLAISRSLVSLRRSKFSKRTFVTYLFLLLSLVVMKYHIADKVCQTKKARNQSRGVF